MLIMLTSLTHSGPLAIAGPGGGLITWRVDTKHMASGGPGMLYAIARAMPCAIMAQSVPILVHICKKRAK